MSGAVAACALAELLRTTITAGTDGTNTGFNSGIYGSMAATTFKDRAGTSRTIIVVIWDGSNNVVLFLNAPGIPNSDQTFRRIFATGAGGTFSLARSAATYDGAASGGLYSKWTWSGGAQPASSGANAAVALQ